MNTWAINTRLCSRLYYQMNIRNSFILCKHHMRTCFNIKRDIQQLLNQYTIYSKIKLSKKSVERYVYFWKSMLKINWKTCPHTFSYIYNVFKSYDSNTSIVHSYSIDTCMYVPYHHSEYFYTVKILLVIRCASLLWSEQRTNILDFSELKLSVLWRQAMLFVLSKMLPENRIPSENCCLLFCF